MWAELPRPQVSSNGNSWGGYTRRVNMEGGNRNNSMGWEQWTVALACWEQQQRRGWSTTAGELSCYSTQSKTFPALPPSRITTMWFFVVKNTGWSSLGRIRIGLGELYESNETSTALWEGNSVRKGCHTTQCRIFSLSAQRHQTSPQQNAIHVWLLTCALSFAWLGDGSCKGLRLER